MPFSLSSFGRSPLSEQLLLIAIDRRSGRLRDRPSGSLAYAIAGAMLTDLLACGAATLIDGVVVAGETSDTPLGETFLREVREVPTPQSLGYWVNALTLKPFLAQAYAIESLRRRGAITIRTRRLAGVWPITRFVVLAVGERERTLTTITRALTSTSDVDADSAALITLAVWCGLLNHIIARPVRRAARRRVRLIVQQKSDLARAMVGQLMPPDGGGGGG